MAGWYPSRDRYFADLTPDRPIFQGDIFRGVPTVFVDHPASHEATFAGHDPPTPEQAERRLTAQAVRDVVVVRGHQAMVLPHPCDFAAGEKGSTHSVRLVAQVRPISEAGLGPRPMQRGQVHHTVWVPSTKSENPADDRFADLRTTTPVDQAYLNPARRVAALSGPAWVALMRRLVAFYTRFALDVRELVMQEAYQHPDYRTAADEFRAALETK